jgi:uncharacterized membrane protein YheB (UPF0754 family)
MSEQKNIVTIELDLDQYIKSEHKQAALEKAVLSEIRSLNFVRGIVSSTVLNTVKDKNLTDLQEKICKEIERKYSTPEQIEAMVKSNYHNISSMVRDIAKENSQIIEKAVMKAMLADGFQKRIADQVENMISENIKSHMMHGKQDCFDEEIY